MLNDIERDQLNEDQRKIFESKMQQFLNTGIRNLELKKII